MLSVSPTVAAHPRIAALVARGARTVLRELPAPAADLPTRAWRKLSRLAGRRDPLLAALDGFAPDLVVFSFSGTYDLVLEASLREWLAARRPRFRIIANWQGEHPRLVPDEVAAIAGIFAAADRIFFVSRRNLATTRRHLLHDLTNAAVIHNPLRWEPADASPWPEADGPRLATVSRLDFGKGIQMLLHALAELRGEPWTLLIHGRGEHEPALRAAVAYLGLSERVEFAGYVPALRAIWSRGQLLCSPAIDDGVPMTIPEAMLCSRPVLATCVGGAEDWIDHGRTGFLVPAPTVPLLAAGLREALAARGRWPELGRAAAAAARERYRPDDYLQLIS